MGRPWWSPRGGVWMTVLCPLDSMPHPSISLVIAAEVCEACEAASRNVGRALPSGAARIKWPNDIMVSDRKLAGVLCEIIRHRGAGFLLVGVGINANLPRAHLPDSIAASATTLREALGRDVDLDELTAAIAAGVARAVERGGCEPELIQSVVGRLWGVGEEVLITGHDGAKERGTVQGLSAAGELLAVIAGRQVVIRSAVLEAVPAAAAPSTPGC